MSTVLRSTQSFTDSGHRGYPSVQEETPVGLKEFLRTHSLPCFAKISRGGSATRRSATRDEDVYLHCAAKVSYVVADEMSVVHRKHIQPTSQRFYVPLDCRGWFEVLSQDGISARPLGSVAELAKLGTSTRCLVRQSIGGYVRKTDGYDSQIVRKGDVLSISETLWISSRTSSSAAGTFSKQLLRCTDQRGQEVFLDLNQRGLFSPIAGSTNVAGAHSVKSLLTKFRLPVMVRLLYGNIGQATGSTYSTGVFKLMNVFADEIVFAMPLKSRSSEDRILPVPTRAKSLKLRRSLQSREEMLPALGKHCKMMVSQHLDTILSISAIYESSSLLTDVELEPLKVEEKKDRSSGGVGSARSNAGPADPEEEELYREIEDIYNNIANPIVPRPIVFTIGSAARGKPLRRNMTAVPAVKAVQQRPSSSAQKTRVIDDNWQMLPRELGAPVVIPQTSSGDNERAALDAQDRAIPRLERIKRKAAAAAPPTEAEMKRGENLYEEIPYFSKTRLDDNDDDETGMDQQKTLYISDNSIISCHDSSSPDGFDGDVTAPKSENRNKSTDFRPSSSSATIDRPDAAKERRANASQEVLDRHRHTSRPRSFAGTPFSNELEVAGGETLIDKTPLPRPPPPLPPKRGESMCNLTDDLDASVVSQTVSEFSPRTPRSIPEVSMALDPPTDDPTTATLSAASPMPGKATGVVDRRPSSRVSSAVKTLGNVSRSFLNTFRRIGGGRSSSSSATLVSISNLEDAKQPDAKTGSKESVGRASSGSSSEPQMVVGDKPEVLPESNLINRPNEDPAATALRL